MNPNEVDPDPIAQDVLSDRAACVCDSFSAPRAVRVGQSVSIFLGQKRSAQVCLVTGLCGLREAGEMIWHGTLIELCDQYHVAPSLRQKLFDAYGDSLVLPDYEEKRAIQEFVNAALAAGGLGECPDVRAEWNQKYDQLAERLIARRKALREVKSRFRLSELIEELVG